MGEDSVSLTAAGTLDVQAAVQNAIHAVLGNNNDKLSLSSRDDLKNLKKDSKMESINKSLDKLTFKLNALLNVQINAVKNSAAALKVPDQALAPLDQIAAKLELIYGFIKETFKPTGLGSEDDNKGTLEGLKPDVKEKKEKETKEKSQGSAWVGGTIVAATLMAIKDYLEETWVGLAQRFLKPFVAVQLAIKGLPKSLTGLNSRFAKLSSNIGKGFTSSLGKLAAKFPRLSKFINNLLKPLKWVTTKVKGLGRSITSAVKNFKFSKIFAPVTKVLSKLGGAAGFGSLFRWLSPIGGLLKKLAFPITLLFEAFEAFKMIFVGSFTKNAEAMAESISEKGVLGRAWYGFTHMFQTIAAAASTMWDTVSTTVGILFSEHPDGIMGKIKDFFTIISTPVIELFKDFIIYPIQKALSWIPGLGIDDPDDVAAALEKERAELGLTFDEEGNMQSGGPSEERQKEMSENAPSIAKKKIQADKVGLTVDEYEQYKKERTTGPSGMQTVDQWLKSKQGKVNESSALPKPNTTGPYQGAGSPHGQALLNQNATAINITNQVKLPTAGEIINQ
tara:strand:- start:1075 stop:2760 length:1686 start_codon:yes stop_codon:yes gene_type:complete